MSIETTHELAKLTLSSTKFKVSLDEHPQGNSVGLYLDGMIESVWVSAAEARLLAQVFLLAADKSEGKEES